jgi:hypothetical protein
MELNIIPISSSRITGINRGAVFAAGPQTFRRGRKPDRPPYDPRNASLSTTFNINFKNPALYISTAFVPSSGRDRPTKTGKKPHYSRQLFP